MHALADDARLAAAFAHLCADVKKDVLPPVLRPGQACSALAQAAVGCRPRQPSAQE